MDLATRSAAARTTAFGVPIYFFRILTSGHLEKSMIVVDRHAWHDVYTPRCTLLFNILPASGVMPESTA